MRRAGILLALTLCVAVAGCGGGGGSSARKPLTKEEYQAKLEQIAKDVGAELGTRSATGRKISKAAIDKVVTAVRSFVDRLETVNPPAEVAALHRKLLKAMTDLGDEFPDIARKLNEAKDATTAFAAILQAKAVKELAKLQSQFKAKGYDLNLSG